MIAASSRASCRRREHSQRRRGRWRRSPTICWTAASRSPGRPSARWSSTRSTPAPASSWPTSKTPTRPPGTTASRASATCATPIAAPSPSQSPEGKQYELSDEARRALRAPARLAPGREALPGRRRARSRHRSSISACTSSTTAASCSSAARRRTSTCPSWRAISKRGCGTMSSSSRRTTLGIPSGTIRATVLIETILAAFEMDEILYELRDHSAGLNCGRWDYIFSFIKKFSNHPGLRPAAARRCDHDAALSCARMWSC